VAGSAAVVNPLSPSPIGGQGTTRGGIGALVINTNYASSRTDAELARYDYVLCNPDQSSRIPTIKALNSRTKMLVYQNALLTQDSVTRGVTKTEMDANPSWYLRSLTLELYVNSVNRDSPDAFWPLQETVGPTADDLAAGSHDGTYNSNVTVGGGQLTGNASDKSAQFNGSQGMSTTYPIASSTQNWTFEGWAIRTNNSVRHALLGSNQAGANRILLAALSGSNDVSFWPDTSQTPVTWFGALPGTGVAFHWALKWTANSKIAELFINGVSKGQLSSSFSISASSGNVVIGAWHSDISHDPWLGRISHVSIVKGLLADGRIQAHYANGPSTGAGGNAILQSELFSGNWLADVSHPGYQARWLSNVRSRLASGGWEGFYADDIDDKLTTHISSVTIADPADPYTGLTQAKTITMMTSFLSAVVAQLKSEGYFACANFANSASRATWATWMPYVDGGLREFWKKFGTGASSGVSSNPSGNQRFIGTAWLFDQGFMSDAVAANIHFIPITYCTPADTAQQLYCKASFLLEWDGSRGGFAYVAPDTSDPYTDYWAASLGDPIGAKIAQLSLTDAFRRNFYGGAVFVNANASTRVFDTSDISNYTKTDGTVVGSSLSLASGTAEILREPSEALSSSAASVNSLTPTPEA